MNVVLTSKENYDKLMEWFCVQPKNVIRDFPIPEELIVPVPACKAQLEELLSENPYEYRKQYAESLNGYYYTRLRSNKEPSPFDKELYVALNSYNAQFFDVERYTKELREVTGDNRWRFDKVDTHTEYGKTYCFIKEE